MTTPAVAALILQIEVALHPLADALQAVPMRVYMLDQFAFLGIRATPRRQALRGLPLLNTWTACRACCNWCSANRGGTRWMDWLVWWATSCCGRGRASVMCSATWICC